MSIHSLSWRNCVQKLFWILEEYSGYSVVFMERNRFCLSVLVRCWSLQSGTDIPIHCVGVNFCQGWASQAQLNQNTPWKQTNKQTPKDPQPPKTQLLQKSENHLYGILGNVQSTLRSKENKTKEDLIGKSLLSLINNYLHNSSKTVQEVTCYTPCPSNMLLLWISQSENSDSNCLPARGFSWSQSASGLLFNLWSESFLPIGDSSVWFFLHHFCLLCNRKQVTSGL